jgi:hypothetical protein
MRHRPRLRRLVLIIAAASLATAVLAQMVANQDDIEGYLGWTRLNAQRNFIESPHAAPKDVYVNDVGRDAALGRSFPFPEGTVLVKETTDEDALRVAVITAMRKVAGFDPDRGDWQYAMFERQDDGSFAGDWVATDTDMHQMCTSCHQQAADRDYAFLDYMND